MRWLLMGVLCLAACGSSDDTNSNATTDWAGDLVVVWHNDEDSVAPRSAWGDSGYDPLADYVDASGTTPYELLLEIHSGSPTHTDAEPDTWGFPLHFGMGGPFAADGELHMFECSARGAVFDQGDYLAFCQPGEAILYLVYLAEGRVAIDAPLMPPASIASWWESTIAYRDRPHAERLANLEVVEKYAYYGRSSQGYRIDVTFEPSAQLPPEPWNNATIERWRVAKFDDR